MLFSFPFSIHCWFLYTLPLYSDVLEFSYKVLFGHLSESSAQVLLTLLERKSCSRPSLCGALSFAVKFRLALLDLPTAVFVLLGPRVVCWCFRCTVPLIVL